MASSRSTRKASRTATPEDSMAREVVAAGLETGQQKTTSDSLGEWAEPELRPPAPSFEDHRGLERHGVLEQMAPLGTMPSQKLKLRVKQYDPTRRSQSGKAGIVPPGKSGQKNQEAASNTRRSGSKNTDTPLLPNHSSKEKHEEEGCSPEDTQGKAMVVSRTPTTQNPSTPNTKTAAGQERLRQVVESAVERSRELGNEILGLAIHRLFEESLVNRTLAELLDAVLSQHPSDRQKKDFQTYIKSARKQIKMAGAKGSASPAAVESKEPSKSLPKASRRSNTRNMVPKQDVARSMTSPSPAKRPTNGITMDTASEREERPPKRVKRFGSVSSTSSLSSTHSLELEADDMILIEEPISTPVGPKGRTLIGPKMSNPLVKQDTSTKRSATTASAPGNKAEKDEISIAELAAKKRKLLRTFDDVSVDASSVRSPLLPKTRGSSTKRKIPVLEALNVSRLGVSEDPEDARSPVSSVQGEFLIPPPPGALRSSRSRGQTPSALGRPRSVVKRSARIKMSPMKKKSGVIAGIARVTRAREHEVEKTDDGDGDNADFCAACGGNGELLCCDGCTRSFHFGCLDPPMNSAQPPEGEWFCFHCEAKRTSHFRPSRGLFGSLHQNFEKQNPVAFSLPVSFREYFEGVKTGEEGEYEEVSTAKIRNHKFIPGYDELHNDNLKIKDAKGNVILCFSCGKTALGRREVITCDYCDLKWHLDCLDPPLSNPPIRENQSRQKLNWMCPAHTDQELLTIGHSGRRHKVRRPKNPKVVDTTLRRGFRNNGIIEIENDPSDVEENGELDDSVVYRVSEQGLKLDFIDRIKKAEQQFEERRQREVRVSRKKAHAEALLAHQQQMAFNNRPILVQQTALMLTEFARQNADLPLGGNRIQHLINSLISEAPAKVVAMVTTEDQKSTPAQSGGSEALLPNPPTPPISDSQERGLSTEGKKELLLLIELAARKIAESDNIKL